MSLDQNIERVNLPGTADNFTFKQMGNRLTVYDNTGITPTVSMPVQGDVDGTQIGFTNQTCDARLVTGTITICGATVPSNSPQAIWPLTPTSTVEPQTSGISTASIFLSNNDFFTVADSGAMLYGGSGTATVTIANGTTRITLDQNIGRINLTNPSTSYTFKQTGNKINVYDATGTTLLVTVPVQGDADGTVIGFSNGVASAQLTSGVMTLGGATVSSGTPSILTNISPVADAGGQIDTTNTGGTNNSTSTSYFPLTIGSSWQYKYTDTSSTDTSIVEVQKDGRFKSSASTGDSYISFTSTVNGIYKTKDESLHQTITYTPGDLFIPANMSNGNVISTNISKTYTGDHPGTSTFTTTTTVVGNESVIVPAGTFNAIKIKREAGIEIRYWWFVQGIGLVKEMGLQNAYDGGWTLELMSYIIK